MGKRRSGIALSTAPVARIESTEARHVRATWSLPSFAFVVSTAFVLVPIIDPTAAFAMTREVVSAPGGTQDGQTITVGGSTALSVDRSEFGVSRYHATAPAVRKPDQGTAQAIAYDMVLARGWDDAQYACLVSLWNRESHWNVYAENKKSGAYGIAQALPGSKMASVAADWQTNPVTQITWGLGYIADRYENPCGAWASSERRGWY